MTPVKNGADREDTPQADKTAHSNNNNKPDEQDAPISGRSPASKRTEEQASAQSQQSLKSTETEPLKKDEIHQRDSTKQDKVSGNIDSPNDINLKSKDKSNRAKESKSETASDKQSEEAKSSKASVKPGNISLGFYQNLLSHLKNIFTSTGKRCLKTFVLIQISM